MAAAPRPTIYGASAHVWLREFARRLPGRRMTLAQVPDAELDHLQGLGVSWLWLIGAWQTGPHGRAHAINHPELRKECRRLLDDFTLSDMIGSPYAIHDYRIHKALGGDEALLVLRERLARRGIKLMLDFVPNHLACDHPWVSDHPDYFVPGTLEDLDTRVGFFAETSQGDKVLRYGKDPNFGPWTDTAQLDWRNPAAVQALVAQVERLTALCDGLRCDMAMLVLNDVFRRTWGPSAAEPGFEPWSAIVAAARARSPDFVFLAEVYWGMEERLTRLGFDWVYDKVLYDRLRYNSAQEVLSHLRTIDLQARSIRFLENHDEMRAATAFPRGRHEAAAVIAASLPGPFFLHHGQMEGRREKLPIQLGRAPSERVDEKLLAFYRTLLHAARGPASEWRLLECRPAWENSVTAASMVAQAFRDGPRQVVCVVNFAAERGHCYVELSGLHLPTGTVTLHDQLTGESYQRDGRELQSRGLFVELPGWGAHLFRFGSEG